MSVQRYSESWQPYEYEGMAPDHEGGWVRYEDHEAEVARLREALEKLRGWRTPAVLREGDYDRGMLCGVEDRGLQSDGYGAMRYGWDSAIERVAEEIDEIIRAALAGGKDGP